MCVLVVIAGAMPRVARAQVATVTVPAAVSFIVRDVSATTAGSPGTTDVAFANASGFANGQKLRISVQADASTFSGPGMSQIPASKISWTASSSNGNPSSGTLAAGVYTQVYQTVGNLKNLPSGYVNLSWSLAPIAAAGLRSGTYTLTIRWKFEAF